MPLGNCIQFIPLRLRAGRKEGIMTVKKAIIPCAGFGTRFLPATKAVPKELFPIVDAPALYYILEEAEASHIEEALIVISPRKRNICRLFKADRRLNGLLQSRGKRREFELANRHWDIKISFAVQRKMTGNGMAISVGKKFCDGEPFAVLFGDDIMYTAGGKPVTAQLIEAYERTGKTVVGCQRTDEATARKCGVMKVAGAVDDRITNIEGIVEKPEGELPSDLVSLGRFVLTPDIFDAIKTAGKTDGEIYLTDAISELARRGRACACLFDGRRYDIGDKAGYLEAVADFALRDEALGADFREYLKKTLDRGTT